MSVSVVQMGVKLTPYYIESPALLEELPILIEQFQKNQGSWITANCQKIERGTIQYYGIRKDQQMQKNISSTRELYQQLKSHLLQKMGLSPGAQVIQVVGDSSFFSLEGTERAKSFLRNHLSTDAAILYGYTGHVSKDGTRCANAAVTDVVTEKGLKKKTIANLVGYHTPLALKSWGTTGPELQTYIVVYGDDETCRECGTVFGDDVTSSDFLTDKLLLLEGGAQSFRQVCNALLLSQEIVILSGLRSADRAIAPDGTPFFSASKFLQDIRAHISRKDVSIENLQEWYKNYFGKGKCYVGDPRKPDFDTKQKLIDDAWALIVEEKLYLKLPQQGPTIRSKL